MLDSHDGSLSSSFMMSNSSEDTLSQDSFNSSSNVTEVEHSYIPYHLRPETYIVPIIFALIFIIGALGNGTLIYIFIRNKNLRNVPNTYIISLSIGDLLVIGITVPFLGTIYTIDSWPYGVVICKFSEFVRDISIGVSVFTLTALSADRFLAIVNPMRKHMGGRAGSFTVAIAIVIWIGSIILALPAVIFSEVEEFPISGNRTICVCTPYPTYLGQAYPKTNVMFKFLLFYVIPLIIITVFYSGMARHLLLSSQNMPGESQNQLNRQIEARKKVATMVLSFVVMFAICFFPTHIYALWFHFDPNAYENYNAFWHTFRIIGFCLSFINSCINPIALYCVSRLFRKYYNHYLFCCFVPNRRTCHKDNSTATLVNFHSTVRRTSTTSTMLHSACV